MERYASLTKERLLNFKARINESSIIKILTFKNSDGTNRGISGKGWRLPVYQQPSSRTPIFTLTEGDGLTVQGDDNHQIAILVSASRATVRPDVYFGRLYSSIEDKTWLNGDWEFHNGKYDGVTETDEIIVYENGDEIIIEVSDSGGSVTLASLGTTLQTADADTPQDTDTSWFYDVGDSIIKLWTWATQKATLKTYFDTLYWKLTGTSTTTGPAIIEGVDGNYIQIKNTDTGLYETYMLVGEGTAQLKITTNSNHVATFLLGGSGGVEATALMSANDENDDYVSIFVSTASHRAVLESSFADFKGIEFLNWIQANFNDDTLVPKGWVDAQILSAVAGLMDYRGVFDASVNAYPNSGGSGTGGAILKSDFWIVSVAGTLPTGLIVAAGDLVIAKIDTPGNTQANWSIVEYNIGYTPENAANKENTTIDTSTVKYPTVNLLKTGLDLRVLIENTAVALTDGAAITLTATKHTLTTDEAAITITDSYLGDFLGIEVILSGITATTWTLPANSLGAYNGVASGTNSIAITGAVSGDRIVFSRWKCGSNYSWVAFNFGQ